MRGLSLFSVLLFLISCSERHIELPNIDPEDQYAYFPLEIGKYRIYAVDSTVYDPGIGDTIYRLQSHTLVREMVVDTLRDNTGALFYRIERSERPNTDAPWQIAQVLSAERTANQAFRTENNLRFLQMVFPMDTRTDWDGNLWIDASQEIEIAGERMRPFANWHYEVDSIDAPAQIGPFAFDSTLLITEADENNIIERRLSRARYAKHIGLVQRTQWILDSQYCNQNPAPADCITKPWEDKAEKGYILQQTLLEHN